MKKLLAFFFIMSSSLISVAESLSGTGEILFQVGRYNPTTSQGGPPRGPIVVPSASLDGNVFCIESVHPDYMLYIIETTSEGNVLAFQVLLPASINVTVLPLVLSGTYELQLYDGGSYYFYSEIRV